MNTTTQPRWRSLPMWTAIASQAFVMFGLLGLWDRIGMTSDTAQGVVTAVLEILTLVGVLNNPTSKTSW